MNWFRSAFAICFQNFRKWRTDYRIWMIALLMLIMIQIYVDDMRKISSYLEAPLPIWIFPFMYCQFHTKLIYTLPVVLLFCNAPFTDSNQIFVMMRSGRKKWLAGQILYIAVAAGLYYFFLLAVSVISPVLGGGELTAEWGKTILAVQGNSPIPSMVNCNFVDIPSLITTYFTPLQAVWFTFLNSWLCGTLIGLIVFLLNLVSGTKALGVFTASAIILISALVSNSFKGNLLVISPVSWNTLDKIDVGGLTSNPSFAYCITFYIVSIAALTAIIFISGRKKSLDSKEN